MQHSDFVHLHLHTQYSLLDGAIRLEELFSRAREYQMPAVAMTDHGNIFGAIEFYKKACAFGLKPIIGCEVYLAHGSRFEKETVSTGEKAYHLILLVKNIKGYRNLCKLVTSGYLEGFYYKPRIDKELLQEHNEGLIAMSACLHGEIPYFIHQGNLDKACEAAGRYKELFNNKRFYLELMDNKIPEQGKVNRALLEIGRRLDIPVVATNDCHYLNKEDAKAHDCLLCIQTGKTIHDSERLKFTTNEFYFKSPEDMRRAFYGHPDALKNTIEIAERCNLELNLNEHHFPLFPVPEGESLDSYLEKMARLGLEERLKGMGKEEGGLEHIRKDYYTRLERELDIIKKMGYSGYFLVVSDFINYARSRNIPVGPGRGSAAGSLTAYALKITNLDPIAHKLIFERFLNPERVSLPDIDIDFCIEGRDEVIAYVSERYGKDNVAQIITFGKMQARAVVRDVGRGLNLPYAEVDRIAKLIPASPNITIDEALKQEPKLKSMREEDTKVNELIEIARSLEGLTRHASTHAAGVVISNRPLVEYMPLYKGQKEDVITTHYAMNDVESLGLLKFDFLGLKTLTVIDKTLRLIEENQGIEVCVDKIPEDDPKVYELLSSGATNGIFQLEGSGVREILVKLKPECFEDIIAVVALYRPGPLGSGMVEDFIERKHGKRQISYELPQLKEVLENTYGVIVYQEQVMQIATLLADFSPGDADILRRAMGKKKPEEMEEQKEKFLQGAKRNKIPPKKAEKLFDLMAKFAGYGFNKSHSAAYALIAYQTAYLKAHYPIEFMTALITLDIANADKVMKYIGECREMGIDILPPDVNEGFRDFTISKGKIRFGLAAVKNVGDSAIDAIVMARGEKGRFTSLIDFCKKVDLRKVNRRVIESLIKSGAFDFTALYRSKLIAILDNAIEVGAAYQKDNKSGQISIFDSLSSEDTSSVIDIPNIEEWNESKFLVYEKESLGFYITKHPMERYIEEIRKVTDSDSESIGQKDDNADVKFCGIVNAIKEITTKKGEKMAFVTIEDTKGYVEVIVFPDLYRTSHENLRSDCPLVLSGKMDRGDERIKVIADTILPLSQAVERVQSSISDCRGLNPESEIRNPKSDNKKKVCFRIDAGRTSKRQLEAVKEVLSNYPGECDVFLYLCFLHGKSTVIALPERFRVSPTEELGKKVRDVLGYDALRVEGLEWGVKV